MSSSKADKQKEEDVAKTVPQVRCAPASESPPPTIIKEMEEMFLGLEFNQTVAMKLVDDQGIDFPWTLASLSDNNIATICDMICRPGGLVSGKTPDRVNQISVLAAKNLKLAAFMFKSMECCSKDNETRCANSMSVLQYQHQWELEQKTEVPKVIRTIG